MQEYELEFEVSTETNDFTIKYWFTVSGKHIPQTHLEPAEYPELEVTGMQLQICDDEWIEVHNEIFEKWASDNQELFFEGIAE